jgi:hypothetical protein
MSTAEQKILNNYLGLLEGLTPRMKLDLIERLKESAKINVPTKFSLKAAFGAWKSEESAEELIISVRSSRNTNREIEKL